MRKNSMYKSLEPYAKLVNFLSAALGDNCEIALHDLTSKDQEIVAISNNPISGREVGAKIIKFIFTLFRRKNNI